jgi:hypothetical protein
VTGAPLSRVAKLLPMLGSDNPAEVAATAGAIGRVLNSAGMSWHDLAGHVAAARPPAFTFRGMPPKAARKMIAVMQYRGRMPPLQVQRCEAFRARLLELGNQAKPISAEDAAWLDELWNANMKDTPT